MITHEYLKSILDYNKDTGLFTWKLQKGKRVKIGDIAGSPDGLGYVKIKIDTKKYRVHRLAWLYVYGYFPENFIDHVNGIRDDNKILNLREANSSQNRVNSKIQTNNKLKVKGVSWSKSVQKFHAQCAVNKISYHIGYYEDLDEAKREYQKFAKELHGEFYRED